MSPIDGLKQARSAGTAKRRHWPIQLVLLIIFGGITVATAAAVGLGFYVAAIRNAGELTRDIGKAELRRIGNALDSQLQPAAEQAKFLADFLALGHIDPKDERRMRDLLLGSLAAISQLEAVAYIAPDYTTTWATGEIAGEGLYSEVTNVKNLPSMRQILAQARERGAPSWSAPMVVESGLRQAMLVAISPVMRDGAFAGAIAAGVSLRAVASRMSGALGAIGSNYFVMTADGRILFHSGLSLWPTPLPGQAVLPDHTSFSDPVLRAMKWPPPGSRWGPYDTSDPEERGDLDTIAVEEGGADHIVVYRMVRGYGQVPWAIGFHLSEIQVAEFATTLNRAIPFALVMLAVSLVVSLWLGRVISRPIRELAAESRRIARLHFDAIPPPRSRLTEIVMAVEAQARMRSGLQWLSHYIPRRLIPTLMREASELRSREADVVVFFSDIIGFSRIAEGRRADRVAALLNRHFTLLGACIEAEGGTIDKYIGDSVMAFWGAPVDQPDRSRQAQRAVAAMAARLKADNRRRAAKGLAPIRIRIGLHRGSAVVGNIGAPGRINYTLVGDTVNIAQRLEQFGRDIDDGMADAIVVASAEAIADLAPEVEWWKLGGQVLSGRSASTELFQMWVG